MNRIEFRNLISLGEAEKRLKEQIVSNEEDKPIEECEGMVLAEDVYSDVDVPGFDRAGMDGYAVKAEDTFGAEEDNPVSLEVVGEVMPGEVKELDLRSGEAIEVATGAVIPEGANAVVMVEFVDESENMIDVRRAVAPDENIMYAGSDILAGEKILSKGDSLNPRDIGLLGAVGEESVRVYSGFDVGVLSIGEELVTPGTDLDLGEIFDCNSFSLRASLREIGLCPAFYGVVGDDLNEIKDRIRTAIEECDIVLTSGSTSAGSSDLMHSIAEEGKILFHGVAVKPGKPTIAAELNESLLVGLPGYPTSALTIYTLLIDPLLREAMGLTYFQKEIHAQTATKIRSTAGRRHFHPVGLVKRDEKFFSYPIEKGSGAITSLAQAEGFLEIKEDENYVPEKSERTVRLFSENIELPEILFIGSHSIGVDLIKKELDHSFKSLNVGSSGGFRYMGKEVPDISGVHLLSEKGEYNIPFLEKYDLKDKAALLRGYKRIQGLYVQKNNPYKIQGIKDLADKDVRLMNRNKGSGTRTLLDIKLKKLSKKREKELKNLKKQIKGYNTSSKTHSGVASAIKLGKADVGLGTQYFAEKNDLGFIPINEENYDFLINKKSLDNSATDKFIEKLRSQKVKEELNKLDGITTIESTGKFLTK